ncbi:hypothetical protein BATDEDRAFT_22208 [Batrachochytrium dendrobatidis JAM81]|uniref:Vps72/YL1 C-terminal domain-containing protein n=1 Tax=Batrachochytrium dendrobatidis (strain JAM81 / FGSC 10211) TaxID=684364 RepID=F4NT12_BATDJ|nr:uncharacterized protein BATDEDRAFT_22208 [Batrachochytrium dendrobatidis JAM81]EGF83482.1 hypothetical protein BATDEDRAFT_22208 [Batrachochytrium dendrobatidis JAM81]KAJ8327047.1 hypothetical protein O5D80_004471 [Batrachochytrium dendrobatidis]KAK5668044.1 hypothetical protein QVD99_005085 [Batrachochytrium dendrobatidis]|eukprot:XP_006675500.1 hypothetical protein BATDEDRAFT_22208 [Batrachochytrium dendrobatidis JAM81]
MKKYGSFVDTATVVGGAHGHVSQCTPGTGRSKKSNAYMPAATDDVAICPITGLPAKYTDPLTGTPYATPEALDTIQQLANGEYGWAPSIKGFIHRFDEVAPKDAPEGWLDCTVGRPFVVPKLEPPKRSTGFR